MRISIAIALALLACGCSNKPQTADGTEDWLRALSIDTAEAIFIDRGSVTRARGIVSLRTLEVARPAKADPCCRAEWVGRSFDCRQNTVRRTFHQETTMAGADGPSRPTGQPWAAAAENSTEATLLRGFCHEPKTGMFDGPPAVATRDVAIAMAGETWEDPVWNQP